MNTDEETTSLWEPSTESTQLGLGWWARPRLGAAWTPQRLDHVKGEARLVCNHDIIYTENIAIVCLRCQSLGGYGTFALRPP